MPSIVYNSAVLNFVTGVVAAADAFKAMLVTSAYTPNKDHTFRSDVTGEVTGTGYTAGGAAVTLTATKDNTNDRVDIATSAITWTGATISNAVGIVIYRNRGGTANADELVGYFEFAGPTSSTGANFTVQAMTAALRYAQA